MFSNQLVVTCQVSVIILMLLELWWRNPYFGVNTVQKL
jgi:hypothetical protein